LSTSLEASSSSTNQDVSFSNDIENTSSNSLITRDIVGIFSNQLLQYKQQNATTTDVAKTPIPRLKTARYGEVSTTLKVLNRLKEAQEKKNMKKPAGKRGRPKKNINIRQPEIATTKYISVKTKKMKKNAFHHTHHMM